MERIQLIGLYRAILGAARRFPSKKRASLVQEVRSEFRINATETDHSKLSQQLDIAIKGLQQLEMYSNLPKTSSDWSVNLEQTPMPNNKEDDVVKKE